MLKNNPDKARMIVDSKDDGIYYNVTEIATFMPEAPKAAPAPAPTPAATPAIDASNESAPIDVDEDF